MRPVVAVAPLLIVALAASASARWSDREEAGPLVVAVATGSDAPVNAGYDDHRTPAPGDDEVDLEQRIERVQVVVAPPGPAPAEAGIVLDKHTTVQHGAGPALRDASEAAGYLASPLPPERAGLEVEPDRKSVRLRVGAMAREAGLGVTVERELWYFVGYEETGLTQRADTGDSDETLQRIDRKYQACTWVDGLPRAAIGCPVRPPALPVEAAAALAPRLLDAGVAWDEAWISVGSEVAKGPAGGTPPTGLGTASVPDPRPSMPGGRSPGAASVLAGAQALVPLAGGSGVSQGAGAAPVASSLAPTLVPGVPSALEFLVIVALTVLAPVVVLYHRLRPDALLGHAVRARIVDAVRASPALSTAELSRQIGLHPTTIAYHARLLCVYGFLEVRRVGNEAVYFAAGAGLTDEQKRQLARAKATKRAQVLEALSSTPKASVKELAARLGTSRQNLRWHLRQLEDAGLVRLQWMGRRRVIFPGRGAQPPG